MISQKTNLAQKKVDFPSKIINYTSKKVTALQPFSYTKKIKKNNNSNSRI